MKLVVRSIASLLVVAGLVGCASSDDNSDDTTADHLEASPSPAKRALVVVSAARTIEIRTGGDAPAGIYLGEVAIPVRKMLASGIEVTFVSPNGGAPTIDPISDNASFFHGRADYDDAKARLLAAGFEHPKALEAIADDELRGFDALFIPGGHAPATDLRVNRALGHLLELRHAENRLTGSICHGPTALLSPLVDRPDAPWIYAGYRMTAYSNVEEKLGFALHYVDGVPKVEVEDAVKTAGALYEANIIPFTSRVLRDRELVTGQNPQSAEKFADVFVDAILHPQATSKGE